ncbi:MAG: M1 family metallopeptidase [Anaerolineae bacterium]
MVKDFSSNRTVFVKFFTTLGLLFLWACSPGSSLVQLGIITPTPTPDPYSHHRALLQPAAAADIEAAGPPPQLQISARLSPDETTLTGVMKLTLPASPPELFFRLYPNLANYNGSIEVSQARVNGSDTPFTLLAGDSALQLAPPPAAAGAPAVIELAFATRLGQAAPADDYTLFGWAGEVLSLPGFFPMPAARQNGEWVLDVPPPHGDVLFSEVALYQLELTLPGRLVVASSGVPLNVINNADGSRTWQLAGGPLRDFTIIAGPFQAVSANAAGATVTSYYLPGHETTARAVLGHAAASLRLYSDSYGPYPYTKLDVVEAPLGYRGMEYSGLVLIGDALYRDPREFLTFLVAHEVAHQWWYAVVGNNPYRHPWLDEGLTEYSAFDYYRGVFGQSRAEELLTGRWQIPFAGAAAGGIDGTVDRAAAEFDPLTYELLVYSKAALFFNALRETLGDDTYRQVLQSYYAENRYAIATPQTLLATAQRVSGQDLTPLADKWLK